jgi:hypothetical protein
LRIYIKSPEANKRFIYAASGKSTRADKLYQYSGSPSPAMNGIMGFEIKGAAEPGLIFPSFE